MRKRPGILSIIVFYFLVISCSLPMCGQALVPEVGTPTFTPGGPTATVTPTFTPTFTAAPGATACAATVTAVMNANVRKGPSTAYDVVGNLLTGQSAPILGKVADGSWWQITFSAGVGGKAWIANSTVTATCLPASVAIIEPPPPPSGSCKDSYVWRLINSSDKVCVPPASKSQADADNAAAASRLCTATYGADTCAEGYVWRDAFAGDHVCVPPATRSQAAADNAAASSRWVAGAYGPHTCVSGFVWREATGDTSDDVCVTPDIRSEAAADNSAAASRFCTATYGADTCAQGYVWRDAFSGDHVCVTPDIRTQAQNDNANASSHTWP